MNTTRRILLMIYGFVSLALFIISATESDAGKTTFPVWIGCTIFAACLFFAFTPRK